MASTLDDLDSRGKTALHRAVMDRRHAEVARLLHAGANPNIRDKPKGYTPMWYAISQNQDPLSVKLLTLAKAQLDQVMLNELLRQSNAEPLNRNLRSIRETLSLQPERQKN